VVVLGLVERVNLREIVSDRADVVCNDVQHHPDSFGVCGVNHIFEVLLGAEVLVNLLPVAGPVAVVAGLDVIDDGADPDGVEAHAGDVVEVVLNSFPGSAAVVAEVTTSIVASVVLGESIGEELVNSTLLPSSCVSSQGSSGNQGCDERANEGW